MPGKVGQAFSFDGSTGFVEIPDAPALRPVSLTLEAWVMFEIISGIRVIFAKTVGGATSASYVHFLQGASLAAAVGDAAAIGAILTAAFSPVLGLWYHVA